jgi:hypothetical protein
MNLIVKIQLNQEWFNGLEKRPMVKKGLKGLLIGVIDASLIGRGKVIDARFDNKSN